MDTILTRGGAAPFTKPRRVTPAPATRLLRLLSAVALAVADRLTLPQRDLPPEFFRFPPF